MNETKQIIPGAKPRRKPDKREMGRLLAEIIEAIEQECLLLRHYLDAGRPGPGHLCLDRISEHCKDAKELPLVFGNLELEEIPSPILERIWDLGSTAKVHAQQFDELLGDGKLWEGAIELCKAKALIEQALRMWIHAMSGRQS